jgi:hypothetical protein
MKKETRQVHADDRGTVRWYFNAEDKMHKVTGKDGCVHSQGGLITSIGASHISWTTAQSVSLSLSISLSALPHLLH